MFFLRGGYTTYDARLDFLPYKDERSRQYNILAAAPPEEGPQKDTILYELDPKLRLNQGKEGQCVLYAITHALMTKPHDLSDKLLQYGEPALKKWMKRRYHDAQRIDEWEGGSYPGAYPFYEGTSLLAAAKSINLLKEYRWAFGEQQLHQSLLQGHGPAVIGVNWYSHMHRPNKDGLIRVKGSKTGGHAIMVRGVDKDLYRLTNSWGNKYGINGECFLSRQDMDTLLQQDGECLFPLVDAEDPPEIDWMS